MPSFRKENKIMSMRRYEPPPVVNCRRSTKAPTIPDDANHCRRGDKSTLAPPMVVWLPGKGTSVLPCCHAPLDLACRFTCINLRQVMVTNSACMEVASSSMESVSIGSMLGGGVNCRRAIASWTEAMWAEREYLERMGGGLLC